MKKAALTILFLAAFVYLYSANLKDMTKIRKIYVIPDVQLLPHPETGELVQEEWRDVADYPDYKISNYGRLMSFKKGWKRLLKAHDDLRYGYKLAGLYHLRNGKTKLHYMHRVVAKAFIPNPENKPFINHKDLIKYNNFVHNLEWCTHQENIAHAYASGVGVLSTFYGEDHGNSKLTDKDVLEIRRIYDPKKWSQRKLAKRYGVVKNAIKCILDRQTWKHI